MSIKLSDFELGWLVGLLEGEGTFSYHLHTQRVSVAMIDEDTIATCARLLSKVIEKDVNFIVRNPYKKNEQDLYKIALSGESARKIMRLIVPHMHSRRRKRVWQSLNEYKSPIVKLTKEDSQAILKLVVNNRKASNG